MTEQAKAARSAYNRGYYARNKERIKQQHNDNWERKAARDGENGPGVQGKDDGSSKQA